MWMKLVIAVNMVSKQEPTSEFQIQQEDFPALPGAQSTYNIRIVNAWALYASTISALGIIAHPWCSGQLSVSQAKDPGINSHQHHLIHDIWHHFGEKYCV